MHNYGPHIFHTDDEEVFSLLSNYTEWIPFKLQPKGFTELGIISLPYSKKTIKEIGRELTQDEIIEYIFKSYSERQWDTPISRIPASIINRIPKTKDCEDPTWFEGQKYQCIPKNGYTAMMQNMLDGIKVHIACKPNEWRNYSSDLTIFTGRIDDYYDKCFGVLPYRSLDFVHKTSSTKFYTFVENQCVGSIPFSRRYDHSYFTPGHEGTTIITDEYPKKCEDGDIPYYPIPFGRGVEIFNQYNALAEKEKDVIFLGRLASYKYLDMWMAIKHAMLKVKNI